ncbi:MAG TPA: metallophosphatase family protein [Slackia equolifaciens]|uniref:Phosphoesterase n=1 Tax=Slackia equolifaciens TaxID=498718 RepID=A0A9D3A2G7_9ACTN|nr:metallophosphatase family protein [Slackia equolifaciens]
MLVGIIADTHGSLPRAAYNELADCDHIVHAGDIGGPEILEELRTLAPVTAVLGNNDIPEYGELVGRIALESIGGVRFLVTHTPASLHAALSGRTSALAPGDPLPTVAVHGHTHVPRIECGAEAFPARMLLCPGSPVRPRGGSLPSVAKLLVENGIVVTARIVELRV